jgi:hypothetical protein
LPYLERVFDPVGAVRQPSLDRREPQAQLVGQGSSENEAARSDRDDPMEAPAAQALLQRVEGPPERAGIAEDRRDVLEEDSGLGEVGNVADQPARFIEERMGRILAKPAAGPMGGWDWRPESSKQKTLSLFSNASRREQGKVDETFIGGSPADREAGCRSALRNADETRGVAGPAYARDLLAARNLSPAETRFRAHGRRPSPDPGRARSRRASVALLLAREEHDAVVGRRTGVPSGRRDRCPRGDRAPLSTARDQHAWSGPCERSPARGRVERPSTRARMVDGNGGGSSSCALPRPERSAGGTGSRAPRRG